MTSSRKPDAAVLAAARTIDERISELRRHSVPGRLCPLIALLEFEPKLMAAVDRAVATRSAARGAVPTGAKEGSALANVQSLVRPFLARTRPERVVTILRRRDWDEDGLLGFAVSAPRRLAWPVQVLMPPSPLETWSAFERCYIDGNSWMAKHAPNVLCEALRGTP